MSEIHRYGILEGMGFGRGRLGMTMVEVLFTMFFLATTVLLVARLLDAGLQASGKVENRVLATLIADSRMTAIRAWAATGDNFQDWTSIDGASYADPEHPEFTVSTDSAPMTLYSPCSAVELAAPPGERREMTRTARKVQVRVRWGPGEANRVSLCSIVAAPMATLEQLVLQPTAVPNPLGKDGTAQFSVQALDDQGDVLPDVFFEWSVLPGTGNGSISPSRDGSRCDFIHRYNIPPSTTVYYPAGSSCQVEVRAVHRGDQRSGSYTVNLTD